MFGTKSLDCRWVGVTAGAGRQRLGLDPQVACELLITQLEPITIKAAYKQRF